ncbi:nucleotidyl transferase AbiEii/AbiGii toxin family protein [uncultured Algimonas sp.]|uniref:nucleotidyl transferase AbiEii/AbiGii toxin family protein n=1 Tax=uncultured Algimonas sp. TaxID=1547920 RepID=UPI0026120B03|nr:nucleotidyl transferase AbiEii/AbiGii toxin family protein [uncultured Algimonas sp.]
MAEGPKNIAASVRQRLLNIARSSGQDFQTILIAYALERILYRLSQTPHREAYILKGGMLVTLWTVDPGRFTVDIDFSKLGTSEEDKIISDFTEILTFEAEDGLSFGEAEIRAAQMTGNQIYGGVRLKTVAFLERVRIPITIDLGFGDAITSSSEVDYGSMLDMPSASVRAYSPATVIAEKYHAVVSLGLANTRFKDCYDLYQIPRSTPVDHAQIAPAVKATFARRKTEIPRTQPIGLSDGFANDPDKVRQWKAYTAGSLAEGIELSDATAEIWARLSRI